MGKIFSFNPFLFLFFYIIFFFPFSFLYFLSFLFFIFSFLLAPFLSALNPQSVAKCCKSGLGTFPFYLTVNHYYFHHHFLSVICKIHFSSMKMVCIPKITSMLSKKSSKNTTTVMISSNKTFIYSIYLKYSYFKRINMFSITKRTK